MASLAFPAKYMFFKAFRKMTRRLRRSSGSDARDERQTQKDQALARRFRKTFEQDLSLADVQGLHFYAKDGVVTIYGTVRHELDRDLIVSFVRRTPGVKDVVSHLQLDGP